MITVLIALGIVASIVMSGNEQSREQQLANSMQSMQRMCNFVCTSEIETLLSTEATLPSGSAIYADAGGNAICSEFKGKKNCVKCSCDFLKDYELNLDTAQYREMFQTHKFTCSFERLPGGIRLVECKG